MTAGGIENLVAVQSDQRLVGGDHVFPCIDSAQGQIPCQISSAHQLDHDADLRIVNHRLRLVGEGYTVQGTDARFGQIPGTGVHDLDGATGAARDFVAITGENIHGAATHGAEPEQTDLDRLH